MPVPNFTSPTREAPSAMTDLTASEPAPAWRNSSSPPEVSTPEVPDDAPMFQAPEELLRRPPEPIVRTFVPETASVPVDPAIASALMETLAVREEPELILMFCAEVLALERDVEE